ncbi:TIGR02117 family protein [Parasediminibacterium sp. JCM 36343]|uniref:TIGR02117 family protein n=1 Tax=Parasediminibacterium sp. JCM 36343 TaxID=3374279 RepID=UPI00397DE205
MRKVLKYTGYTLLGFVAFILIYLAFAYSLSHIGVAKEAQSAEVAIYIKTNGVHTDLVVPVKNDQFDWSKKIKFSNTTSKDTTMQYLAMGWGDKGFYLETPTWADLKCSVACRAAFGLSTTAIHATFYKTIKEDSSCKKIMIGKPQYQRLINYIDNSFRKDSSGHVMFIFTNANYNDRDAFYEAKGSYSLFHTCNTWANNGLKASGQKACIWTPADKGIFSQYK